MYVSIDVDMTPYFSLPSSGMGRGEEAVSQYLAAGKLESLSEYCGLGVAAYKCGKFDISREGNYDLDYLTATFCGG